MREQVRRDKKLLATSLRKRIFKIFSLIWLGWYIVIIQPITRNKYIRQSIAQNGFKLPANESDVMKLLHKDFDEK